jgi:hypothetical protein
VKPRRPKNIERLVTIAVLLCSATAMGFATIRCNRAVQENFPPPPADRTLIYWLRGLDNALVPLPTEAATTRLHPEVPAGSDKMGRVEFMGETAVTRIPGGEPHFFLFVPDTPGVHPPLLVRLTAKGRTRRASAMAQRGQRGLAIVSEEIVKPHYRVLRREGGTIYMEVWAREPLALGEYAFIGSDLAHVPTFTITKISKVIIY